MQIAMCQLNPTVGAVDANAQLVLDAAIRAHADGADLAVFPEQVLAGYPAEDLWLKPHFIARCAAALERIAPRLPLPAIIGLPVSHGDGLLANAAVYIADGAVRATYRKQHLPNYAVFDEERWFTAGSAPLIVDVPDASASTDGATVAVGITICEDAWIERGPVVQAVEQGADVVVNLSASPWRAGRAADRETMVRSRAREAGTWFVLVNQACGQDELVFDGHSLAAAPDGTIIARGAQFAPDIVHVTVATDAADGEQPAPADTAPIERVEEEIWRGLQLGLGDYVRKNGFASVVLGLSGGIDSAIVLALAVDALGAERVHAATMPSRFSSEDTRGDAHLQAQHLGVTIHELAIEPIVSAFEQTLAPVFDDAPRDLTEENLQARVRGTLLMALSNKHGHLVLATGNKSEMSVGYSTLYGDLCGGFAPIKDVPKTMVFRLARWRNEQAAAAGAVLPIPPSVIERPPTAELREDQLDSDSLPDYDELDAVLELLVDQDAGIADAVAAGFDEELVVRVQRMVDRAEYKRRQAPPGTRVSDKAFGRDRRMPITNGYDGW